MSTKDQVHKVVESLIALPEITAYICFNELIASFVLQALLQRGIAVPDCVSVVGFGDSPESAEALSPPLTTVRSPLERMAAEALEQLYGNRGNSDQSRQSDADERGKDVKFPGELIIRASSAHCKVK
jgi:DNA-binding LacI/PurR family transcriptional regulator